MAYGLARFSTAEEPEGCSLEPRLEHGAELAEAKLRECLRPESGQPAGEGQLAFFDASLQSHPAYGQRLASLQVVRALAVCLVVLNHVFKWAYIGAFGVDLFFVLSGFVIASTTPTTAREFLTRRFLRIYPIYWLMTLPVLLFATFDVGRFMSSLTLWPFWGEPHGSQPYLGAAWTLCYEVLFYCSFAVGRVNWRIPVIGLMAVQVLWLLTGHPIAAYLGSPIILEFLAGVALTRVRPSKNAGSLCAIVAVVLLILVPHGNRLFMWTLPAALLVYAAITAETRLRKLSPAVKLGDASYSIYLAFGPLTASIAPIAPAAAFCVSLLGGLAVHRWVEKPMLRSMAARPK
jgi:exopolysaccharide production protein ExoZ